MGAVFEKLSKSQNEEVAMKLPHSKCNNQCNRAIARHFLLRNPNDNELLSSKINFL